MRVPAPARAAAMPRATQRLLLLLRQKQNGGGGDGGSGLGRSRMAIGARPSPPECFLLLFVCVYRKNTRKKDVIRRLAVRRKYTKKKAAGKNVNGDCLTACVRTL